MPESPVVPLPTIDEGVFDALVASLGDATTVEMVLGLYLEEAPATIDAVRSAQPSGLLAARDQIHRLKGNAGFIGATALSDACRRYEEAVADRRVEALPALAGELIAESEAVCEWLGARAADRIATVLAEDPATT